MSKLISVTATKDGVDITAGKTYPVSEDGRFFYDDSGDARTVTAHEGHNTFVIRNYEETPSVWDDAPEWANYYGIEPSGRHHWFNLEPVKADGIREFARGLDTRRGFRSEEITPRLDDHDGSFHCEPRPDTTPAQEEEPVPTRTSAVNEDTAFNYVIFKDGVGYTDPGKPYVLNGKTGEYLDNDGDRDDVADYEDKVLAAQPIEFIVRCLDAPNKSAVNRYISKWDESSELILCDAGHKAAALRLSFEQVVTLLQFSRRKFEAGKHSEFEVLLAPIRVGNGRIEEPKPQVGAGGNAVGTVLRCLVSDRSEILVGEEYEVVEIDSDGDELIKPVHTARHPSSRYGAYPSLASNPEYAGSTEFTVVREG